MTMILRVTFNADIAEAIRLFAENAVISADTGETLGAYVRDHNIDPVNALTRCWIMDSLRRCTGAQLDADSEAAQEIFAICQADDELAALRTRTRSAYNNAKLPTTIAGCWEEWYLTSGMAEAQEKGLQSDDPAIRELWKDRVKDARTNFHLGAFMALDCLQGGADFNALMDELNRWQERSLRDDGPS